MYFYKGKSKMSGVQPSLQRKAYLGISLKLFIAFWLIILTSVFVSYLVTMQLKHSPSQQQANPKQLKLLNKYTSALDGQNNKNIQEIQNRFHRRHHKDLIIKQLDNNKIYLPRMRGKAEVEEYLQKHSLINPVTIDFGFIKLTSSEPFLLNNTKYQIFIARKMQKQHIFSWVTNLPKAFRVIMLLSISFLACWLLAKSFTRPLIALQKASKEIGDGNLSTRITKFDHRLDEFGDLARSFNQMASQLESNISSHQRLLGDVSHELRSPLTRLQMAVALAEKNIGNVSEQKKHLSRCEMEVERLDDMIADVLTLSRLEHNQNNFTADSITLNSLISEVVTDCQYYANDKDVTINFIEASSYSALVDVKLLSSAIGNIINNAVKYSDNNSIVKVELTAQDNEATINILDNGPGVPDDLLEKLFTPFFRVADSRDRNSGGTGLGLAIAQQAVQLHQGEIIASNQASGGLKVTIALPLTQK